MWCNEVIQCRFITMQAKWLCTMVSLDNILSAWRCEFIAHYSSFSFVSDSQVPVYRLCAAFSPSSSSPYIKFIFRCVQNVQKNVNKSYCKMWECYLWTTITFMLRKYEFYEVNGWFCEDHKLTAVLSISSLYDIHGAGILPDVANRKRTENREKEEHHRKHSNRLVIYIWALMWFTASAAAVFFSCGRNGNLCCNHNRWTQKTSYLMVDHVYIKTCG